MRKTLLCMALLSAYAFVAQADPLIIESGDVVDVTAGQNADYVTVQNGGG